MAVVHHLEFFKSSKFQLLVRFECVDLRPILVDVNRMWLLCVTVLSSDEVLLCIVTNMYSKTDDINGH